MQETQKIYTQILLVILTLSILFTFDKLGSLVLLRNIAAYPVEFIQLPVLTVQKKVNSTIDFLANLSKIEEENNKLNQQLASISAENAKLRDLAQENQVLREQLNLSSGNRQNILGKVVGISRFLVITTENNQKVTLGSTVTLGNNFVGQVVELGSNLVKVRLPTDPANSIPAIIDNSGSRIYGNLVGRYGRVQILDKVQHQEIVPIGSIVKTAGDKNTPPGLVLGRVVSVTKNDPNPFLEIEVESFLNFSELTTVFVVNEQ